jgi:outer membrane lipoprotein
MKWLIYIFPLFLIGCSSLPKTIQAPPANDLQLEQVSGQLLSYKNSAVRWGGKIITVNNDEQGSLLQSVQFPLNNIGRPVVSKNSQGRFLVESDLFLDPEVFKKGTLATFSGFIRDQQVRQIDKKQLLLPVIQLQDSYLWPKKTELRSNLYHDRFAYPYRLNGFYGWPYYGTGFRCF